MPSYCPGPETWASCRQTASFLGASVYSVVSWAFVFGLTMGEITWTIWRSCVCTHGEGGVCRHRGCWYTAEARIEGKGGNSISHSMERDWIWGREEVSTHPSASATTAPDIIVPAASAFPVCPGQVKPGGGWEPDSRSLHHP